MKHVEQFMSERQEQFQITPNIYLNPRYRRNWGPRTLHPEYVTKPKMESSAEACRSVEAVSMQSITVIV